nr:MAG: RNA-dependent RNA-polymerase [Picobirnavirus sp.]
MKKVKVNRQMLDVIESNNGLSIYLDNLNRGRQMTPHSWLYEKEDSEKTLQRWIPIMEAANNKTKFGKEFNSFDLKQVEKFGPQGGIPPITSKDCWDVIDPLYSPTEYDNPDALSQWYAKADEFGKAVFRTLRRAHPLTYESVVKDMARRDTLTTNSGYPRFTRRKRTYRLEVQDAKSGLAYDYPAIVLFRYYYGKLRPVWMFPMSDNLIEASFALKVQSELSVSPLEWVRVYVTPWRGFEYVKRELTAAWKTGQIDGGDTTKMDAHMRPAQLKLVYTIIRWLFQERYWDELLKSLMHISDIGLLIGKDTMLTGVHGLASGSSWTQLSETVLQMFMAYVLKTSGQGIGDDFYWQTDLSADELVEFLAKFGLPANPTKQSVSKVDLTFLQRYFHQSFFSREDARVLGAYYPTIRALGSMLMPEKFHDPKVWNSDMFCTRNYTILENCVDDPSFGEFVKFVAHGHKDMIPFAKKRPSEIDNIQKAARSVPGLFPSYNQEKLTKPLSSFEAIKIARRL